MSLHILSITLLYKTCMTAGSQLVSNNSVWKFVILLYYYHSTQCIGGVSLLEVGYMFITAHVHPRSHFPKSSSGSIS